MRTTKQPESKHLNVPAKLLRPLWFRSRESLLDDGLVYDPIASYACRRCHLASDCLSGNIDQSQLLHATLTQVCDLHVKRFLEVNPNGWVINVGAGLDTRFYRLDNGRCRWIEIDTNEHLVWRQRLFYRSERYQLMCGSIDDMTWLQELPNEQSQPILVVCEQALLDRRENRVAHFIQSIGCHFQHAQACVVLAGDHSQSRLGMKMGCEDYAHGFKNATQSLLNWLPWIHRAILVSPIDQQCLRWSRWQRILAKLPIYKNRLTPNVVNIHW
ncbi:methyltransferase [Vibrio sp. 10N.286.49.C2]|uniref:class I SAM-dependent methyltransferase n=1 Tax=unclassified Vibrio TaxID=2614977 RepID=UPI000C848C7D|nr:MULTISPECIES: class I SAM-dependent methyltransferase [unclassified Vibrio]PMH37388.1 methyltransferase [Vibrio sp. 10N.286.49.C2]PMH49476.1 methyltransferase [Vibrio sp. 10N.286.49.B1]PMH81553.1 methyltransferase [Vibrio sp. 10N.286.48.B7]